MKVRAMKQGFYGGARRRVGDVFEAEDRWMPSSLRPRRRKPKPKSKAKPKTKPKAKGGEPTTFSEIARTDSEAQAPKGADDLV